MMIDWNQQIKECLRENRVMPIFHGAPMSYKMEHVYIVQELIKRGYGDVMILNWMKVAGSTMINDLDDVAVFRDLAKKKAPPKDLDFKIFITKGELEHINSMVEPIENKAYLLAWVCYAKMMVIKRKRPSMDNRYISYLVWVSTGVDNYSLKQTVQKRVWDFTRRIMSDGTMWLESSKIKYKAGTHFGKPVFKEFFFTLLKSDWIEWDAKEGEPITSLDNGQVIRLANLAFEDGAPAIEKAKAEKRQAKKRAKDKKRYEKEKERKGGPVISICPECGKEFFKKPHSRTDLCEDCYKRHRTQANRDYKKASRDRKKDTE